MEKEAYWAIVHNAFGDGNNRQMLALLETIDDVEELFSLSPAAWRQKLPGTKEELLAKVQAALKTANPGKTADYMAKRQIRVLGFYEEAYPMYLRNIDDPPALLYCMGAEFNDEALRIAMVGTRNCSEYGKKAAFELARDLSMNHVCVVSGLARGIDGAAHAGALEGAGGTIAVLGTGVDKIYPGENRQLAADILAHPQGTIISEFPLSAQALPYHFPQRNRIISGLADGLAVVEAGEHSGALISAELALEQGKEVFAVPGSIFSDTSLGCHNLLRDGARIMTCAGDVLAEYGVEYHEEKAISQQALANLSEDEQKVLQNMPAEAISIDELGYLTKLAVPRLLGALSMLEINGLVKQLAGRKYIRLG